MVDKFRRTEQLLLKQLLKSSLISSFALESFQQHDETEIASRDAVFRLCPSPCRVLSLMLCESRDDDPYVLVEVGRLNSSGDWQDGFMLEDWMQVNGLKAEPFPFLLSYYGGSIEQQIDGFVKHIESIISRPDFFALLRGDSWVRIASPDDY